MSRFTMLLLGSSLLLGLSTLSGCNFQIYDPSYWHTGFVAGLQKNVGRKFERVQSRKGSVGETGGWAMKEELVDQRDLPNGHIAYKYRYQGTCRYTFEVDPMTDIIVAASWEGDARHCAIVP